MSFSKETEVSEMNQTTPKKPASRRGRKPKEATALDNSDCVLVVLKHSLEILNWMDNTENIFIAPQRKGKTLPMLAKVFRADLSLDLEEKNSISSIVCSPCDTIQGDLKTNLATEMSQNNTLTHGKL